MGSTDLQVYQRLRDLIAERRPAVLATIVQSDDPKEMGRKALFWDGEEGTSPLPELPQSMGDLPHDLKDEVWSKARTLFNRASAKSIVVEEVKGPRRVAFEQFQPPHRLVIAGGGHIGLAIYEIARLVGFWTGIIDDRPAFANQQRFPKADLVVCQEFSRGMEEFAIDQQTSVAIVTRGHMHDLHVLRAIMDSKAAYIGMIGSRRRVLTVLDQLRREGVDEAFLERLYAPIGLDIGADSPQEIALSVVAEVVTVLRGGAGGHLRWTMARKG